MADFNKLKDTIRGAIYPNGRGAISADKHQAALLDMADTMQETAAQLTELSEETSARFERSAESVAERFEVVDTEIEQLKRGEAYVFGETLAFRNYADAMVQGNTLTL
jgi:phosphotransacetylase